MRALNGPSQTIQVDAEDLDGSRPADGHVAPAEDKIDVCGGIGADGISTCHLPYDPDMYIYIFVYLVVLF
jgi:hypothetical protein